ncbi:hypothetical protein XELAEV_18041471mg [Xenopus laevis]|uniref:Uncharacterized protein n=1 Tax=Xenopus laevis TaxID=8355 RepID=A0A974C2G7_XENLA|nr:hypothetical protein XELAEV_18041471mg [Xenopus laevis]
MKTQLIAIESPTLANAQQVAVELETSALKVGVTLCTLPAPFPPPTIHCCFPVCKGTQVQCMKCGATPP